MAFLGKLVQLLNRGEEAAAEPRQKPGRNDPCWCGSGKKYKKCHWRQDSEKAAKTACSLNCGPT